MTDADTATQIHGRGLLAEWSLTFRNLFLPIFCKQCRRRLLTEENGFFCPTCWELSPRIERPFCSICGRPHGGAVGFDTQSNFPCADCREPRMQRRPFRRMYGAAHYDDAIGEAIKLLKFHGKNRLVKPLGTLMLDFAARELEPDSYDFLIPVPLYRVRERERGFNQSRLLAQELLPFFARAKLDETLRRIRPTLVQSQLKSVADRRRNVAGAFAVVANHDGAHPHTRRRTSLLSFPSFLSFSYHEVNPPPNSHLKGKSVLLVDDVVTTASTVRECATALRRAGAQFVDVFATALATETHGKQAETP